MAKGGAGGRSRFHAAGKPASTAEEFLRYLSDTAFVVRHPEPFESSLVKICAPVSLAKVFGLRAYCFAPGEIQTLLIEGDVDAELPQNGHADDERRQ